MSNTYNEENRYKYTNFDVYKKGELNKNLETWLENENYEAIFNCSEFKGYIQSLIKTKAVNNTIGEEEMLAMFVTILWERIPNFELYNDTETPAARFKSWIKDTTKQLKDYTGRRYKWFVNMNSCASSNFGQLEDSFIGDTDGSITKEDFVSNYISEERLNELGLNDRDKKIIRSYYYDNDTQQEIADDNGISQPMVIKILKKIQN